MQYLKDEKSGLDFLKFDQGAKKAVVLFHGYGASMNDLAPLHQILRAGESIDWFFPDGPLSIPLGLGMIGKAWFPVDMVALEQALAQGGHRKFADQCPTEFVESLNLAQTFLEEQVFSSYEDVVIGGFSQGAMLSSHLAAKYADRLKGVALLSATLLAEKNLCETIQGTLPFYQSHGKSDPLLSYFDAKSLYALLSENGWAGEFVSFEGEHEIPPAVIDGLNQFLKEQGI